jgi:hypothetical protein
MYMFCVLNNEVYLHLFCRIVMKYSSWTLDHMNVTFTTKNAGFRSRTGLSERVSALNA